MSLFNQRVLAMMAEGQTVYHFGFGQSPFPVVDGARRALAEHAGENDYLPLAGLPALRAQICEYHAQVDGLTDLDPELVFIGPGSKQLIYMLIRVFDGDVLLVSPSWLSYKPMTDLIGKRTFQIATTSQGHWKLTPELLEKAISQNDVSANRLLVLCNPNNPTGTTYTRDELLDLSVVLRKYNVTVLSDEVYGHLKFDGDVQCLAKYYPEGTITSSGISKIFGAGGWRCGHHIYPKERTDLLRSMKAFANLTFTSVSSPVQYAAVQLYKYEQETREYVKGCQLILAALAKHCHRELTGAGLEVVKPTGGHFLFPDFEVVRPALESRGITTGEELCETLLRECQVAVVAGGPGFMRPASELTVRLCFVNFNGAQALDAWRRQGCKEIPDRAFLEEHCLPVVKGIEALVSWVEAQRSMAK